MESTNRPDTDTEETAEKIRRDIAGVREILRCIAEEASRQAHQDIERARDILKRIADGPGPVCREQGAGWSGRGSDKATTATAELEANPGNVVTREIDISDFASVEVDCAFRFEITRSDSYRAAITAGEKLFDYINIAKSGNTLRLSLKPCHFHTRPMVEARIAMPTLSKLRQAAATRGVVKGFCSREPFDLNLSGASSLDIDIETGETRLEVSGASRIAGSIKTGDAEFVLSGASRADLRGSANKVSLSGWGASHLELLDFTMKDASVHLKGASQATINARGTLDVELSGASRLNHIGNPTLRTVSVSGASTLCQR